MITKTMATNFTFLIVLLLRLIHCQMGAALTDISTDKFALLAFKSHLHLGSSDQVLFTNWSDSAPVCDWVGVTCSSRDQRVAALNISTMGLTGNLDVPQLRNLTSLVSLNLSNNYFQGVVPQWLGDMCRDHPTLEELYLHDNMLYGQIPSNISQCSRLRMLDLSSNHLGGLVPREIGRLRMLEILSLGDNNLIGAIPEELGNLTSLKELFMSRNQLSSFIPPQIFNISTLESVRFRGNNLSGVLPEEMCSHLNQLETLSLGENQLFGPVPTRLYECSALRFFDLSVNNLNGSIPPSIGNSSLLWNLGLTGNRLTGEIPREIGNLNNLEVLNLPGNRLRGFIPPSLFNISTLRHLSLSNNQLTGNIAPNLGYMLPNLERLEISDNFLTSESFELSFITSLTNCRHLSFLGVSDNTFNGTIPASIGNLSASVQNIRAKNCNFRGRIPAEIGNLSSLIKLDLSGNHFSAGLFPPSLVSLYSIQGLDLSGNNIGGSIPNAICGLHSLDQLWLSDNRISGAIPDCLDNITTLSVLKLDSNQLNSIPASLWRIGGLDELNLSSNSLAGSLVRDMAYSKVTQVDLSFNQLSGVIPNETGDLQNLRFLRLAHNELQGSIPESMGNMVSLELLDLSNNSLSGIVPKSLEELQYLTSFNVSFNGLVGEIPSDGPFRNFTFESFMFNKGLCGDPRYRVSRCSKVDEPNKKLRVFLITLGAFAVVLVVVLLFVGIRYRIRKDKAAIPEGIVHFWSRKTQFGVSYYELFEATNRYSENNLIGSGGFGSVYKAKLKNGKDVAVKVFNLQLEGAFKSFEVECEVLRNLRHRNICKVIGCCSNADFKALVLEYKPRGSLEKWLYSQNCFLNTFQRIDIMIDVACALEYLHQGYSVPVIHCDLKPSNILLDENMTAQLCDFGVAKLLGDGESMVQTMTLATLGYVAPEYGTGGFVSVKCDVYSYGIVLLEVLTRKSPNDEIFNGNLSLRSFVKDSMANDIIDPNLLRSDEHDGSSREKYLDCLSSVLDLGLKCCVDSPYERMSIKDVIATLHRIKLELHAIRSVRVT